MQRVIKNRRPFGPRFILQYGEWRQPKKVGGSKGIYRRFVVEWEEFYNSEEDARRAMKGNLENPHEQSLRSTPMQSEQPKVSHGKP
jgi:hypothetical protein